MRNTKTRRPVTYAVASILFLLAFAILAAGCGAAPAPIALKPETWGGPHFLDLKIGEEFIIVGYAPEAVEVKDSGVVQLQPADAGTPPATAQTTFVAAAAGQTELVVTQSMCQTITSSCGEPALYYFLTVHVR